jgi:hypothetical protein
VTNCTEGGKQFPVKGGVPTAHPQQLLQEENEWLPASPRQLLQDASCVGVRCVCSQGKHSVRSWVCQQYRSRQRALGDFEGVGGSHARVIVYMLKSST